MTTDDLKRQLIALIGSRIDEAMLLSGKPSFIEMDNGVIHFAGPTEDRYFRVTLTEVEESEYDKPYDPGNPS